jgi:NAD(P)H-dependent FMN reductase
MIYIISGTNREAAKSPAIAKIYAATLQELGEKTGIIDLRELPEDFVFTALYDNAGKNEAFNVYRRKMLDAEKFVFIVPEYNGSFPGVLKAFIDGLEFPNAFRGKKCALLGLSSGDQGAGPALSHLTDIFNYCGMHVLAKKQRLSHIDKSFEDGNLVNERHLKRIREQAKELVEF